MPGISRGQVIQRNRLQEQVSSLSDSLSKAMGFINQKKQIDIKGKVTVNNNGKLKKQVMILPPIGKLKKQVMILQPIGK